MSPGGSFNGSESHQPRRQRIIVAFTGATGSSLGSKALITLRRLNIETHLVIRKWAESTLKYETDYTVASLRALADPLHNNHDMAAPIASGSYRVDGMIVVPCSMKTLAAINAGLCDTLIALAADVIIKEPRKLILVARECPLSGIQLQNMLFHPQNGAIIFPPVPAFYHRPSTIDDIVGHSVGRMLDLFGLDIRDFDRWKVLTKTSTTHALVENLSRSRQS